MDIQKLSKISGLKPSEENIEKLKTSLAGVFEMMESIEKMPTNHKENENNSITLFENVPSAMISKNEPHIGIHIEDGFFLAPKVIQKNN